MLFLLPPSGGASGGAHHLTCPYQEESGRESGRAARLHSANSAARWPPFTGQIRWPDRNDDDRNAPAHNS